MNTIGFDDIPLFRNLDRLERASLVPNLDTEEYPADAVIVRQGAPGDALYIILGGVVSVARTDRGGIRRELARLGPGDCFGEMAILSGAPRSADVTAVTDLTLLKLSKQSFSGLFKKNPSVSAHLSILLARRFATDPTGREFQTPDEADHHPAPVSLLAAEHRPTSLVSHGGLAVKDLFTSSSTIALLITLLICVGTYFATAGNGLSRATVVLGTLLLGATILWSLDVFSYHAVAVALPVMAVLLAGSQPDKAFSGFS
ncbi:MAG TPA: cyclic nucleotide-binding domain-containing protein, partial [Geobacteraceae bacterium]